ncbi:hypothetical protein WICPIJ_007635 [Wickerhamomyces pijperi]|uniref:Coatomer subunit epsilon n=1 Tax=Wickerhamomyces pijperi TaxID=599730 RepID=A0A9P8PZU2_WICPI|nr:hypothetical protein WICPIJ_007635 [Wickerhamomyces pijperi]
MYNTRTHTNCNCLQDNKHDIKNLITLVNINQLFSPLTQETSYNNSDTMADSDELFSLHQDFFTGNFESVSKTGLDEYSAESKPYALSYKIRSLLKLGQGSSVLPLIQSSSFSQDEKFTQAFTEYVKFYQTGSESPILENLIANSKEQWYVQQVGSLYLVALNHTEEAIKLLHNHTNSLESVLYLISLYIASGRLDLAEKELNVAANYSQDSIIYNIAEALVNSVKNGEQLRGVLYFYEELGHQYPSLTTKLGHFIINLQLKQFEEAEVTLAELQEMGVSSDADLISNEITLASLKGDQAKVDELREQLASINPDHKLLVDYQEKIQLFGEISEKYASHIQA